MDFRLVAVLSSVTVICLVTFLLPIDVQNILMVRHAIFNPLTYITASFVHGDLLHLISNLFGFMLFSFLNYHLNKKVKNVKAFFGSLSALFVILPFLNYSLLNYFGIYKSIEFGFGLSLVDSGLLGFSISSLLLYFKRRIERFNALFFLSSASLFTFCIILLPYPSSFRTMLFLFCLGCGFVFGIFEMKKIYKFISESLKSRITFIEAYLVMVTFPLYFLFVVLLFPPVIISQGGITDIASHYIGLLFGIFPFSFYNILRKN